MTLSAWITALYDVTAGNPSEKEVQPSEKTCPRENSPKEADVAHLSQTL